MGRKDNGISEKAYTLKEEIRENGTRYSVGYKDGQGDHHELEVSPAFYTEFRRLESNNRKLENWDCRHREFSEVWEETLNRRALRLPKNMDEQSKGMYAASYPRGRTVSVGAEAVVALPVLFAAV